MSDSIVFSNNTDAYHVLWWLGNSVGSGIVSGVLGNLNSSSDAPPQYTVNGLDSNETYQAWMGPVGAGKAEFPEVKTGKQISLSIIVE